MTDSTRLLSMGGFANFLGRMNASFAAASANEMLRIDSREFNRFMLDPIRIEETSGESLTQRLDKQISDTALTTDLLENIAQINELDISTLDVSEPTTPKRHVILSAFSWAGSEYGFTISDHLPSSMSIPKENVANYLFQLSSTLRRLRQATDQLRLTKVQENETEIESRTRQQQLVVIEIKRLIAQMQSIIQTLRDPANREAIIAAKTDSLQNVARSVLTENLVYIDAQCKQLQAVTADSAKLEAFIAETEALYAELEAHIGEFFPALGTVICEKTDITAVLPAEEAFKTLFTNTGTEAVLKSLDNFERDVPKIDGALAKINEIMRGQGGSGDGDIATRSDTLLKKVTTGLDEISSDPGVSIAGYDRSEVDGKLADIMRRHNVTRTSAETSSASVAVAA
ncbi:MAG: hypothetical protein A3D65_01135 [Candidatus Lloydbacteria bacterium RIFCSPHIGHO2_02_FULL_50_13]|uniref:Uncharacterized protein n=1 Tax=Candidatus Lloydbacteria bacterium RIFCSPHIGHO2_02_FULL_50_13 TaxID=1798661 RepID=A0A1G2D4A2_9BACT|nr:MAG: hypothetical protein A3D65_01135 [Candidatus Lloydbacteria bacterium RIFCSPHIGHO2_02_FULL_50_13]